MTKRTGIGRVTIPSQNSQQGIEWNTQYQREKEKAVVLIETYIMIYCNVRMKTFIIIYIRKHAKIYYDLPLFFDP